MSENPKTNFRYNAADFLRDSVSIELPSDPKNPDKTEKVTFWEFSKTNFERFVMEVLDVNVFVDPDVADADKKRKKFDSLSQEITKAACKWLAVASGKPEKFFLDLQQEISMSAFGKLLEVLYDLNRVDAILATGGNVAMLPTAQRLMSPEEPIS